MALVIDIETISQSREILEKRMPEEIRNPQMPEELRNPEEPNWQEKCPAYSLPDLLKKAEAFGPETCDAWPASEAERLIPKHRAAWEKVAAAREKQAAWLRDNRDKWQAGCAAARQKWELAAMEAKAKFVQSAALDAKLGHAKLIGMRDTLTGASRVFVWEPDKGQVSKIREWFGSLPKMPEGTGRLFRGLPLFIHEYRSELEMIRAFFASFAEEMSPLGEDELRACNAARAGVARPDCVTYYGNTFDFPFLYRRAWILGAPIVPKYIRGRFFDERMKDLLDVWKFGDREAWTGGLDGLAEALGYEGAKTADGASFGDWYAQDPAEGVVYLINDLDLTEFAALKMGVIRK